MKRSIEAMFFLPWLLFLGVAVGVTPPITPVNDEISSKCGKFLLSSHPIVTDNKTCPSMSDYGVVLPPFYSTDEVDFKFYISSLSSNNTHCYRAFILHLGPECKLEYQNDESVQNRLKFEIKQKDGKVMLLEDDDVRVSTTCNGSVVGDNQLNITLESVPLPDNHGCRFEWDGIVVLKRSVNDSFYDDPMAEEDRAVQEKDVKDYEEFKDFTRNFRCTHCFVITIALAVLLCIFLALCVCSSCLVCKLKKDLQGRDWVDKSFKRKGDAKSRKSKKGKSKKSKKSGKESSKRAGSQKETAKDSGIPSSSTDGKDSKNV
ncbi:unnamed protein product [Bursaphelenchus xylophilus]|nr:unnamed protein product [Bursaphelenchus xylophilus]CAG9082801.1 unnamed protein product [Bursaphelenchus xylophilus]